MYIHVNADNHSPAGKSPAVTKFHVSGIGSFNRKEGRKDGKY
jgi:hypothetical protein